MTPQEFIAKWGSPGGHPGPAYHLNEEQGAQSHFLDLCDLLGVPKPGSIEGYAFKTNPVLEPLDHIECRDALLQSPPLPLGEGGGEGAPTEATWPKASVVIGNPPFLGDKKMRAELGDAYTDTLRKIYGGRVPGGADLVCYWFEKARWAIEKNGLGAAGLVSTNSIRGGANRKVLDAIVTTTNIYDAWSDGEWVNEGAAVRVSLVAFGHSTQKPMFDGHAVNQIHANLTATAAGTATVNLTHASTLTQNALTTFNGIQKTGPFDVSGAIARKWITLPSNPNGRRNAEILKPYRNGLDVTRRERDMWLLDFGWEMSAGDAALFEVPFAYAMKEIKPVREVNTVEALRRDWWRLWRPRPEMRRRIDSLIRYIVTPEVSKHRVFAFITPPVLPDKNLVVSARADDTTFGILHSRLHELWSLRMGTSLEDRPRYTPTTCFETFPFPAGLTPADTAHQRTEPIDGGALIPAGLPDAVPQAGTLTPALSQRERETRKLASAIARAAKKLNDLREAWLNPPEWTERVPEVVPLGMTQSPYPERIVAKPGFEKELAKRTLTNLYNQRPAWLNAAHETLDAAVATAYGWTDYTPAMPDEEILKRLLALNLTRAADEDNSGKKPAAKQ